MYSVIPTLLIDKFHTEEGHKTAISSSSRDEVLLVEDEKVIRALSCLPTKFTMQQALDIWMTKFGKSDDWEELWEFLRYENLLYNHDTPEGSLLEKRKQLFQSIDWEHAGKYHLATRDHPFLNMSQKNAFETDNGLMQMYSDQDLPPNVFQEFKSDYQIEMKKYESQANDNTCSSSLDFIDSASTVLDAAFGYRQHLKKHFEEQDSFLRLEILKKAVPSGGSKHPVEGFVVLNKGNHPKGLYHYNVRKHSLDLLNSTIPWDTLFSTSTQKYAQNCDLIIFVTLYWHRAMWRYRESRSWRAVIFDVGHVIGMVEQVAHYMKLKTSVIEHFLPLAFTSYAKIDSEIQPCIAAIGVNG